MWAVFRLIDNAPPSQRVREIRMLDYAVYRRSLFPFAYIVRLYSFNRFLQDTDMCNLPENTVTFHKTVDIFLSYPCENLKSRDV
jgi:hypothetical protein